MGESVADETTVVPSAPQGTQQTPDVPAQQIQQAQPDTPAAPSNTQQQEQKPDKRVPFERFDAVQKSYHGLKGQFKELEAKYSAKDSEIAAMRQELEALKKQAAPAQRDQIEEQLSGLADQDLTTRELLNARRELKQLREEFAGVRDGYRATEVRYQQDILSRQVDSALEDCKFTDRQELLGALRQLSPEQLADDDVVFKVAEQLEFYNSSKLDRLKDSVLQRWGINPANATPAQEAAATQAVAQQTGVSPLEKRRAGIAPRPGKTGTAEPAQPPKSARERSREERQALFSRLARQNAQ